MKQNKLVQIIKLRFCSMIRSMTGYGRAEALVDGRNILVEIRSVNHRYFEFSCRVPRAYGFLESRLKTYLQGSFPGERWM